MSTAITTIHDAAHAALAANLTGHREMTNPYFPEINDRMILKKGYGLFMGPAENTDRAIDCYWSIRRSCFVTLSIEHKGTDTDKTLRKEAEKALMESMVSLAKYFEREPALGQACSYFRYASDSGIEFLSKEQDNFLIMRIEFSFEYLESTNT